MSLIFVGLFLNERKLILQVPESALMDQIPQSDCGVVLTGSAGRIREAFELLALGKIKKLIISGVYKDTKLHEIFPHLPYYPEIKSENIILEKISGSTRENAVQSLTLVEENQCHSILLITSALHMFRAERIFKSYFPDSVKINTFAVASSLKEDRFYDEALETFKSLFFALLLFVNNK